MSACGVSGSSSALTKIRWEAKAIRLVLGPRPARRMRLASKFGASDSACRLARHGLCWTVRRLRPPRNAP
jgi:hypothetical protein